MLSGQMSEDSGQSARSYLERARMEAATDPRAALPRCRDVLELVLPGLAESMPEGLRQSYLRKPQADARLGFLHGREGQGQPVVPPSILTALRVLQYCGNLASHHRPSEAQPDPAILRVGLDALEFVVLWFEGAKPSGDETPELQLVPERRPGIVQRWKLRFRASVALDDELPKVTARDRLRRLDVYYSAAIECVSRIVRGVVEFETGLEVDENAELGSLLPKLRSIAAQRPGRVPPLVVDAVWTLRACDAQVRSAIGTEVDSIEEVEVLEATARLRNVAMELHGWFHRDFLAPPWWERMLRFRRGWLFAFAAMYVAYQVGLTDGRAERAARHRPTPGTSDAGSDTSPVPVDAGTEADSSLEHPVVEDAAVRVDCGPGRVFVPAASFALAPPRDREWTRPREAERVEVPAFCIDRDRVPLRSCRQSGACRARGCSPARGADEAQCIDQEQAQAYCSELGGRLPSLVQIEAALRGPEARELFSQRAGDVFEWVRDSCEDSLFRSSRAGALALQRRLPTTGTAPRGSWHCPSGEARVTHRFRCVFDPVPQLR